MPSRLRANTTARALRAAERAVDDLRHRAPHVNGQVTIERPVEVSAFRGILTIPTVGPSDHADAWVKWTPNGTYTLAAMTAAGWAIGDHPDYGVDTVLYTPGRLAQWDLTVKAEFGYAGGANATIPAGMFLAGVAFGTPEISLGAIGNDRLTAQAPPVVVGSEVLGISVGGYQSGETGPDPAKAEVIVYLQLRDDI